jgi:hypothetical protein
MKTNGSYPMSLFIPRRHSQSRVRLRNDTDNSRTRSEFGGSTEIRSPCLDRPMVLTGRKTPLVAIMDRPGVPCRCIQRPPTTRFTNESRTIIHNIAARTVALRWAVRLCLMRGDEITSAAIF